MDVLPFRSQFPVVQRWLYLNHASEAPVSLPVRRLLDAYFDIAYGDPESAPIDMWPVRHLLTKLFGGSADEYAMMPNTSVGIGVVANGYRWAPGDNVVVPDEEYPANSYPWLTLQERGVEVRRVPLTAERRLDPAAIADRVDHRTRVLAVSAVAYLTGFRSDLRALSRIAHDSGALFVVDAIQAAGAVQIDVERDGIDVLTAGGYKWLLGPIGTGFLYMRRSIWDRVPPPLPGAYSSVKGAGDYEAEFELLPDARRYESGNIGFSLFYGWQAALQMLLDAGLPYVEERIIALTDRLISGLTKKSMRILSPIADRKERSGILTFCIGSHQRNRELVERLYAQQTVIALRQGHCRVSPHFYNTEADIDRLLEAID